MDFGDVCGRCHEVAPNSGGFPKICHDCKEFLPVVFKSDAHWEYKLTHAELKPIPVIKCERDSYLLCQIKVASYKKHGGPDGLEEIKAKSVVMAEKRRVRNENRRRQMLMDALEQEGVPFNEEAYISQLYIQNKPYFGRSRLTLEQAVQNLTRKSWFAGPTVRPG